MGRNRMTASELEVEIKLLPRRLADLDVLARRVRFGAFGLRARGTAQLYSVYLDTRGRSLWRHGVALRLRERRGQWEATAKWMGRVHGALHERPELTVRLRARPPGRRFELPEGPLLDRLDAIVAGRAIEPILVTEIERRLFDVVRVGRRAPSRANSLAELALDRVRLRAPGKRGALLDEYGEVEIELRAGSRADIRELGARFVRELHMAPASGSKFSRGLELRWGAARPPRPSRGAPEATDTVIQAARKVLGTQLVRMREHDPGTRRGEDPEALHQMRVATRRARAALRFFAAGTPERPREWLNQELRWLGVALGEVRDLDVQLETLEVRRDEASGARARALGTFHAELQHLRARRQTQLREVLRSSRYHRLLVHLEHFVDAVGDDAVPEIGQRPVAEVGRVQLRAAMERLRKRGRRVARGAREPSAADLHALRIRMKRVRYALEFLGELVGKPGRGVVKRLVELQDLLGAHQDAFVAAAFVTRHLEQVAGARPRAYVGVLQALLDEDIGRAAEARARFRAVFRKFDRGRAQDDFREVLRLLARHAAAASA